MKNILIKIASTIIMILGALVSLFFGLLAFAAPADAVGVFIILTIYGAVLFLCGVLLKNHQKVKKTVDSWTTNAQNANSEPQSIQKKTEKKIVSVVCESCGGVNKLLEGEIGICAYCDSKIHG